MDRDPTRPACLGGRLGIAGALGFASVVVALHLAQPEYDARRQPLSAALQRIRPLKRNRARRNAFSAVDASCPSSN
jgi:hypothetical protein